MPRDRPCVPVDGREPTAVAERVEQPLVLHRAVEEPVDSVGRVLADALGDVVAATHDRVRAEVGNELTRDTALPTTGSQ